LRITASSAVIFAHTRPTAGAFNFVTSGLGNFSHYFIIDMIIKTMFFIYKSYACPLFGKLKFLLRDHIADDFVKHVGARAVFYGLLFPPDYLCWN